MLPFPERIGSRRAGLASQGSQPVLERGEGAVPTRELDENRPGRRRDVQPGDPPPPQDDQPTQQRKDHEGQVQHHDRVGTEAIEHVRSLTRDVRDRTRPLTPTPANRP